MGILDTPLSKKGILKALGQDPEKSNVLTVATSSSGKVVKTVVRCTQSEYDLLATKDPETLYVIEEGLLYRGTVQIGGSGGGGSYTPGMPAVIVPAATGVALTDTANINAAIQAAAGAKPVYVPPGTYLIHAYLSGGASPAGVLVNVPGTMLIMSQQTILKAETNAVTNYGVVQVSAPDCIIEGGLIEGERLTHTGPSGSSEWGHCLDVIAGAHRLIVRGTRLTEAWGDGCQVMGAVEDVEFDGVIAYSNRRQGISIIDAIRPRIKGGAYITTAGSPGTVGLGCGILVEPDAGTPRQVLDFIIDAPICYGNRGPGIAISSNGRPTSGTVTGARCSGNGAGSTVPGIRVYGATSDVLFEGCTSNDNTLDGYLTENDAKGIRFVGCAAKGNARHGFAFTGPTAIVTGCAAYNNAGAGLYTSAAGTGLRVSGFVAVGNGSHATWNNAIDLAGPSPKVSGIVVTSGDVTPNYGIVVRSTATGALLQSCSADGTFTTGAYLDLTSQAVAIPVPGTQQMAASYVSAMPITDAGGYYTTDTVGDALQEGGLKFRTERRDSTARLTAKLEAGKCVFDSTLGKPLWVSTAGAAEVNTLTVTGPATSTTTLFIALNGAGATVNVTAGDDAATVAGKIRAKAFSGWTMSGSGATAVFTRNVIGTTSSAASYNPQTSGVTATMTTTTAGTNNAFVDATGAAVA